ncbi:MAG: hypothetical protein R3B48_05060 [Kofleriaceae bacterium]
MIARVWVLLGLLAGAARADVGATGVDAGAAPRWVVALDATSSADRARTSNREGAVTLRGAGFGLHLAVARRLRASRCYVLGVVSARVTGELTRSAMSAAPLPDAALLQGGVAAGVAWSSRSRWWLSAALGPTLALYTSPRALGLTDVGVGLDLAATRSFPVHGAWSIDVAGRGAIAALPDGAQTWTLGSLGLALALRAAW